MIHDISAVLQSNRNSYRILMYHPVFRENHSCSLQLKVLATAGNRHTARTWAVHNVMQFLGLHFIDPELETTPLYHGDRGKRTPCCSSWWEACKFVLESGEWGFQEPNKMLKKVWRPLQSYLLGWHHVSLPMHVPCFFLKKQLQFPRACDASLLPPMDCLPWWRSSAVETNHAVNQCESMCRVL